MSFQDNDIDPSNGAWKKIETVIEEETMSQQYTRNQDRGGNYESKIYTTMEGKPTSL